MDCLFAKAHISMEIKSQQMFTFLLVCSHTYAMCVDMYFECLHI